MRESTTHPKPWPLVIGFLGLLATLPGLILVAPETSVIPHEQREPAPAPKLVSSLAGLEALPETVDAYLRDHIGLRYRLVQLRHRIKFGLFGESPTDALLVGRDGWLFLAEDYGLASYRASVPFAQKDLDAWRALFVDFDRWLRDRGAMLLVVIAPGKPSIHEPMLPAGIVRERSVTRTDQLVAHLADTDLALLDLRPALLEAARERPMYHRLDTHWNGDGTRVAYHAILERLEPLGLVAPEDASLERRLVDGSGDLAKMLHIGAPITEARVELRPKNPRAVGGPQGSNPVRPPQRFAIPDPSLPRAVVYRDSFATALIPLLAEHFSSSLWIWSSTVDIDRIEAETPDVVLYEIAERFLMGDVASNPFPRFVQSAADQSDERENAHVR